MVLSSVFLTGCTLTRPKTGGLQALTTGVPYSVFLNGQFLETAPFIQKTLTAGDYNLKLEPTDTNLASYETTIHVRDKLLTVITWKPGAKPEQSGGVFYEMAQLGDKNKTEVNFVTIPDGAIVSLSNRDKQLAPVNLTDLSPGEHEYEVTLPSYETQKNTLHVVAGHRITVTVKLAKIGSWPETGQATPSTTSPMPATGTITPTVRVATPTPTLPPSATQSARTRQLLTPSGASSASTTASSVLILKTGLIVSGIEVLRVRQEPTQQSTEVGQVVVGKTYPYTGDQKDGWLKINFDNKTGWVSGTYTQLK